MPCPLFQLDYQLVVQLIVVMIKHCYHFVAFSVNLRKRRKPFLSSHKEAVQWILTHRHKYFLSLSTFNSAAKSKTGLSISPSHSSGLPCVPARDRAEPAEGETDEPQDGQQVGQRQGVHRRDSERGAGVLHAGRPLQGAALPSVWLPGGGQRLRLAKRYAAPIAVNSRVLTLVPSHFSPSTKPWWKTIRSSTSECWTFMALKFSKWVFYGQQMASFFLLCCNRNNWIMRFYFEHLNRLNCCGWDGF